MSPYQRVACFGGIYSNYLALSAAVQDARSKGVDGLWCLGDLGAFGPFPDRVFPIIKSEGIQCLQGNYDDSIGNAKDDCQCGYTDPRDNHFAQLSYDYTLENTSDENRRFLRSLPSSQLIEVGKRKVLLCHGSPRRVNEFLWESTTSDAFLKALMDEFNVDAIAATHTGIRWHRRLADGRDFINVGALGRPENDGSTRVWYAILEAAAEHLSVEFIPVDYDYGRLAREMEEEGLPEEFIETIRTGWWTSCLEVLPSKERKRGRY